MTESHLPPISSLIYSTRSTSDAAVETSRRRLTDALSLLFEPSPTLTEHVAPLLIQRLRSPSDSDSGSEPNNYATLIVWAIECLSWLPDGPRADFIGAHPRIGEVKGLSALSATEQGQHQAAAPAQDPVPSKVLERLAFLNKVYERRYPGLVYITFVNGRSRAQIRDELEEKLRVEGVLPAADAPDGPEKVVPHDVGGILWRTELERAIYAIRDIALSRLKKLDVE